MHGQVHKLPGESGEGSEHSLEPSPDAPPPHRGMQSLSCKLSLQGAPHLWREKWDGADPRSPTPRGYRGESTGLGQDKSTCSLINGDRHGTSSGKTRFQSQPSTDRQQR